MWQVWESVRAEAAEDGVHLRESELIGLAPLEALLDVADPLRAFRRACRKLSDWRARRHSSSCATSRRFRRSSCGSKLPGDDDDVMPQAAATTNDMPGLLVGRCRVGGHSGGWSPQRARPRRTPRF